MVKSHLSNLQLQSRLPRCSITHPSLRAAVPMGFDTAGCKPAKQEHSPNRPTFAQCQQRGLDHENPGLLRNPKFLTMVLCNRALATVWSASCRPHLPKVPQDTYILKCNSPFEVQTELSPQSCRFLSTTLPETLLRQLREPHYLNKHRVSRPRVFSPVNSRFHKLFLFATAHTHTLAQNSISNC